MKIYPNFTAKLNTVKMSVPPKLICRFNTISFLKISTYLFERGRACAFVGARVGTCPPAGGGQRRENPEEDWRLSTESYVWLNHGTWAEISWPLNWISHQTSWDSVQFQSKFQQMTCGYWQTNSKAYIWKGKRKNSQHNIKGQEKSLSTDITQFQTSFKAIVIKTE